MTRATIDPMDDQTGDGELARLLEWDVSEIPGAPTRAEMLTRIERSTSARQGWGLALRRSPALRVIVLFALLAAAVVGTVAVGSWLAERSAIVVAPTASPDPSPSLPPAAPAGSMPPGTYTVRSDTLTPFSVTVPSGWTFHDGFISKGDFRAGTGVTFATWVITHVFADACEDGSPMVEVGTGASLVAALAAQGGHDTTGPTEVTFGGLPATRLEFSVPVGFDAEPCNGLLHLWPDPGGDDNGGEPMFPGQTTTIYVIEDDGRVTTAVVVRHAESLPANVQELLAVADSVRFWR